MANQQMVSQELQQNGNDQLGSLVQTYQKRATRAGIWIFWGIITGAILLDSWFISQLVWPLYLSTGDFSFPSMVSRLEEMIFPLIFPIFLVFIFLLQLKSQFSLVMPFHRKNSVVLYTGGLIYREGHKRQVVTWEQVCNVERLANKTWITWRRSYKLHLEGATSITLLPTIAHVDELGVAIEREIIKLHLPQMQADYAANKPIVFTGLCLNRDGISTSDESIPWEAVERISFGVENLIIKEKERGADWFVASMGQFRNACLLEALLVRIREEKGFE